MSLLFFGVILLFAASLALLLVLRLEHKFTGNSVSMSVDQFFNFIVVGGPKKDDPDRQELTQEIVDNLPENLARYVLESKRFARAKGLLFKSASDIEILVSNPSRYFKGSTVLGRSQAGNGLFPGDFAITYSMNANELVKQIRKIDDPGSIFKENGELTVPMARGFIRIKPDGIFISDRTIGKGTEFGISSGGFFEADMLDEDGKEFVDLLIAKGLSESHCDFPRRKIRSLKQIVYENDEFLIVPTIHYEGQKPREGVKHSIGDLRGVVVKIKSKLVGEEDKLLETRIAS